MTDVRLLTRTHYQVAEPAILRRLIRVYTSAVHSGFTERVARSMSDNQEGLNVAAARYAIDLGRALNLVNQNLVWTALGHLLNVVSVDTFRCSTNKLSERERVFFLKIFLEFDGAALIFFCNKIENQPRVPERGENWSEIAQKLFETTCQEYLEFLSDPQARIRVRQLADRRRRRAFRGKSGAHQTWLHIQTLHRLGLADRIAEGASRVYRAQVPAQGGASPALKLIQLVPDLVALETIIRDERLYEVAAQVLGYPETSRELNDLEFLDKLLAVYNLVMDTGVALCPIQTVAEAIQVQSVIEGFKAPHTTNVLLRLKNIHQCRLHQLRFHVDRAGHPAYIMLN